MEVRPSGGRPRNQLTGRFRFERVWQWLADEFQVDLPTQTMAFCKADHDDVDREHADDDQRLAATRRRTRDPLPLAHGWEPQLSSHRYSACEHSWWYLNCVPDCLHPFLTAQIGFDDILWTVSDSHSREVLAMNRHLQQQEINGGYLKHLYLQRYETIGGRVQT